MQEGAWLLLTADLVLCLVLSLNFHQSQRSAGHAVVEGGSGRPAALLPGGCGGSLCNCHPGTGPGTVPGCLWDRVRFQPGLMENTCRPKVGSCLLHKLLPWGLCRRFPDVLGAERLSSILRCDAASAHRSLPCLGGTFASPLASAAISAAQIGLAPQVNTRENRFWGKTASSEAEVCQPQWER